MKTDTMFKSNAKSGMKQPSDPYDTKAWMTFYDANPSFRRSAGAEGVNDDDDVAAKAAADKAAADATAAEEAAAKAKADADKGDDDKDKLTDKEAGLLKDVMRHKTAAKDAKAAADKAAADLKLFEGIDPVKVREMIAKEKDVETKRLEAAGEFTKVKEQMNTQHQEAISAKDEEIKTLKGQITSKTGQIEELTIGTGFGQSKFITDETVLSSVKARKIYGDHFDIVEGSVVGYDKPRGEEGRAPIVDAKGSNMPFNDAIKHMINADPDRDTLLRTKLKPGSGSGPSDKKPDDKKSAGDSISKIGAGLKGLEKSP